MKNRGGQVTIFIIIGIVIVSAIVGLVVFKDRIFSTGISPNIQPIYNTFLFCLEEDTLTGINILESQGGYIELPDFEPGSSYMPFGSQLNFLGNPIPYWYYVSGNNVQKEQVPSMNNIEGELENFIEGKIRNCVFDSYYEQGFEIDLGEPEVSVNVGEDNVEVNLNMGFSVNYGEDNANVKSHSIDVKSNFGKLYDSAKTIYEKEQEDLFLENYAVDTLRLYAPVDGVEMTCSPLTWSADKVFEDLKEAIEINTLALKVEGGDYSLAKKENKYFVVDVGVSDVDVRFVNSPDWANGFEVAPSEGNVLVSKPVGNQPGLGVIGFCYVPYHFVYNVRYPVLVQVSLGLEIFQFPVAVVLEGNQPRQALDVGAIEVESPQLCEYKNTPIEVSTYDGKLNSVDAEISYKCFSEFCEIGKTTNGYIQEKFPQCANGYVVAKADGFREANYELSTISSGSVDIILDRLYEREINLKLAGVAYGGNALVSFVSDKDSKTIVYPETRKVELSEGQYEIQVQIYKSSSLKIEKSVQEQCVEVPRSGVGGIFGLTEEQCFNIEIPEQIISNALVGGGKENYYILESQLSGSSAIEINALSLATPKSLEQLQDNYLLFEDKELDIKFK